MVTTNSSAKVGNSPVQITGPNLHDLQLLRKCNLLSFPTIGLILERREEKSEQSFLSVPHSFLPLASLQVNQSTRVSTQAN